MKKVCILLLVFTISILLVRIPVSQMNQANAEVTNQRQVSGSSSDKNLDGIIWFGIDRI